MLRVANKLWKTAGVVALIAAGALAPRTSEAGLVYDLRFSDGSSTKSVSGPTTLTVELWGRVSGADTNHANDGLLNNYLVLQSAEVNGGAITGGVSAGQTAPAFSDNGRNGQAADLNADGVTDWGSTNSSATNAGYMFARAASPGVFGGGAIGQAVDANTWEFHVATYTLDVTGLAPGAGPDAETRFAITRPAFPTSVLQAYAVYYQDSNVSTALLLGNSDSAYGDYVTVVVPEPATFALAALGGVALLARRRR